ncbi:Hypothetical_protein [Hexamita inflata]|nr:Hypothetical protein HINF_LOCUS12353 [Hexamita inflata]CAI9951551.1 Hypothetical protein HINF_LOCUS39196 [Hexamita inflata]
MKLNEMCQNLEIQFVEQKESIQGEVSLQIINGQTFQSDYDFIITTCLTDFNTVESRLKQAQNKSVKQVQVLNMFDFSQTDNYDFSILSGLLQLIKQTQFQVQDLIDFYKSKGVKFMFKDSYYK